MGLNPDIVRTRREDSPQGIRRLIDAQVAVGGGEEKVLSLQWEKKGKIGEVRVSSQGAATIRIYINNVDVIGGTAIDGGMISALCPVPFVFTVPEDVEEGEWIIVSAGGRTPGDITTALIRGWYE